jgi:hypothetical protein
MKANASDGLGKNISSSVSSERTPEDSSSEMRSDQRHDEIGFSQRDESTAALDRSSDVTATAHDADVIAGLIRRSMELSLDILANLTDLSVTTGMLML